MEKTRDLFKKLGDIMGAFHTRIGMKKERNGMDLTEAEDSKKSCKNTQKNYIKKVLMIQITMIMWSLI